MVSGRSPINDDLLLNAVSRADGEHLIRLTSFGYQGGGANFQYRLVASLKGAPQIGWLPAAVSGPGQTLRPLNMEGPAGQPAAAGDGALPWPPRRLITSHNLQPKWWTTAQTDNPLCFHPPLVGKAPLGTPCLVEAEPNDTRDKAQVIPALCDLTGRLDKARDEDWYRVKLTANKPVVLKAIAEQQGSLADLQVVVFGPVGAPGEKPKPDEKTILPARSPALAGDRPCPLQLHSPCRGRLPHSRAQPHFQFQRRPKALLPCGTRGTRTRLCGGLIASKPIPA